MVSRKCRCFVAHFDVIFWESIEERQIYIPAICVAIVDNKAIVAWPRRGYLDAHLSSKFWSCFCLHWDKKSRIDLISTSCLGVSTPLISGELRRQVKTSYRVRIAIQLTRLGGA